MSKNKKHSFLYGATILAGSMIIVKLIGALFKIPLGNILGNTGMGYFSTAYNLFIPVYTLAVAGFPAAVSRMVSASSVKNRYRDVRKILRISTLFYLVAGLVGSLVILLIAKPFANNFADAKSLLSILCIAPAVLFGGIMSGFRGYYEGLRNMTPTAVSQIIESVAKLIFGLLLSSFVINMGFIQYEKSGVVFGTLASSIEQANLIILPYASAAAIVGVSLSTLIGMIFLILRHKRKGDGVTKEELLSSPKPLAAKKIFLRLLKIAIPISIGALVINITSLIDLVTIVSRLDNIIANDIDKLINSFNGLIPKEVIESNQISNYLWGAYGGLAVSIFNLIPAFTSIFAKSALPNVTAMWVSKNKKLLKKNIESVIRITSLFAIPAGIGIFFMAGPILTLLYSSQANDALVATPALRIMGIAVIFLAVLMPIFAILQAIGKQYLPVIFMLIGSVLKWVINYVLVGIPSINIVGAPIGTIVCYGTILVFSVISLTSVSKVKINFLSTFIKPLIAGLFCGIGSWASYGLLSRFISGNIKTLIAIGIGSGVYLLVLFLIKAISKDDILMLPKGEKIFEFLKKSKLM